MPQSAKVTIRAELVDRLRRELEGPHHEDEVLDEPPTTRYLCGILWPAGAVLDDEDDDQDLTPPGSDDDPSLDPAVTITHSMKPSSIGLSFVLSPECRDVSVHAAWGEYARVAGKEDARVSRWQRTQVRADVLVRPDPARSGERQRADVPGSPGVVVEWVARRAGQGTAVSLFLVNRRSSPGPGRADGACLFQPGISVSASECGAVFVARGAGPPPGDERSPDQLRDDLLYRDHRTHAVGHGTSAGWECTDPASGRADMVYTVTIPATEVPRVAPSLFSRGSLVMRDLAEADVPALQNHLIPLVRAYEDWIDRQQSVMVTLPGELQNPARRSLEECRDSLRRMQAGLEILACDPLALEAFRFANKVMDLQRCRTEGIRKAQQGSGPPSVPVSAAGTWRPFQIAFILQCLVGLTNPLHQDRTVADLLWFTTGGGKTEAYLGLAAYAMGLRRLKKEEHGFRSDAGVSVIMRYTLRLLTIQQFQRAATMVCACEIIRRDDPDTWGREPFRIGLWVGGLATPNSHDECRKALTEGLEGTSPIQLVTCPWCGHPLDKRQYLCTDHDRRLRITCSRPECEFRLRGRGDEGIPAVVVDEEIYRLAPSLVIGTIDKFARLPWVPEAGTLFGRVEMEVSGWGFVGQGETMRTREQRERALSSLKLGTPSSRDRRRLLPPDLIIQDELHLISGPLGTMAGAYETAIDHLCSRRVEGRPVSPKVMASTATIRRAEDQVSALFNRSLAVFPAPGLDAGNSFFAERQSLEDLPGQLHLGVSAFGKSMKTALVRVYATLLASVTGMVAAPEDLDPYYTLVGYFNSLRELGGAKRLLEDDVRSRIDNLARRPDGLDKFGHRDLGDDVPELTSRRDSREIPLMLERLTRPYRGPGPAGGRPEDVVLCSNMISVGVDVPRLGLMTVAGQPKTTSEYIQATSRIGRIYPGLVVTVYNWARPRDLSHYERFRPYHEALYRYVEGISVTPFSSRARDRALPGTFVAMCRHGVPELASHAAAGKFSPDHPDVRAVRDWIMQRARSVGLPDSAGMEGDVESVVDTWDNQKRKGKLHYYSFGRTSQSLALMRAAERSGELAPFSVPSSMREVETPVGIYLK